MAISMRNPYSWKDLQQPFNPHPVGPINPYPQGDSQSGPSPGHGSGGGGGGYNSTFDPLQDPTYRQIASEYKAMSDSERLAMEAGIARQTGYYGTETDPMSLFGRLKGQYVIRDRDVQNVINAHNLWRSGETGYQLGQSRLKYLTDQLDMRMRLEDYVNGLKASFAKSEADRRLSLIQWAWQLAQASAAGGAPAGGSTPPPGGSTPPPGGGTPPPPHPGGTPHAPWPTDPIYNPGPGGHPYPI